MFRFLIAPHSLRFLCRRSSRNELNHMRKQSNKPSNTPRPPKDPPDEGYEPQCVAHDGIEVPEFIKPKAYRQFCGPDEPLGPGAGLNKKYKNGHYFGYHRFSFVELQNQSVGLRDERRACGGAPVPTEEDVDDEKRDDNLESMKEQEKKCEEQLATQAKEKKVASKKAKEKKLEKMCELRRQKEKVAKSIDKEISIVLSDCEDKLDNNSCKSFDCQEMVKAAVEKARKNASKKDSDKKKDAKEADKKSDDKSKCETDKGDKKP
ncbi:uncharacterized protein LOC6577027 [Drosophila mojavensis]|uniref:Uncharacterized protein n=1 Tax=Drosophila mojavensis TaxID=7230 RepID=B4KIT8_DROMO|nr:uncharacterized protein LOC6577027 [Drosophila mojavensis]EDW12444.2 uncharacterized protein Dmoj_GI24793 [Drosophila mojavensis]